MSASIWPQDTIGALLEKKFIVEQIDGNHGELYPKADEFVESGVPYLSANCIVGGRIDLSKAKYLTAERAATLKKGRAKKNDVLFAHNATVGPTAILEDIESAILSTTLTLYRCDEEKLSSDFLFQFLSSSLFRRQYERVMGQSTRNQVPITTQREFTISVPPLEEQKKIAEILSTWDRAIEGKEDVFQKRLRSFTHQKLKLLKSVGGKKMLLKDVAEDFLVPMRDKPKVFDGDIPWLRIEDFTETDLGKRNARTFVSEKVIKEMNLKVFPAGTVICSCSASIGKYAIAREPLITNQTFIGIVPNTKLISTNYLYSFMTTMTSKLKAVSAGSTIVYISRDKFENLPISVPPTQTQNLIADFVMAGEQMLSTQLREISLIKKQKQGLMQKLLTGKVRVKV